VLRTCENRGRQRHAGGLPDGPAGIEKVRAPPERRGRPPICGRIVVSELHAPLFPRRCTFGPNHLTAHGAPFFTPTCGARGAFPRSWPLWASKAARPAGGALFLPQPSGATQTWLQIVRGATPGVARKWRSPAVRADSTSLRQTEPRGLLFPFRRKIAKHSWASLRASPIFTAKRPHPRRGWVCLPPFATFDRK
jgi:hypothetical protein